MPRGGRPPPRAKGASAHNDVRPRAIMYLNALKSGTRSKQLRTLIIALMAFPQTGNDLPHFSRMQQRRLDRLQKAVNEYARLLLLPSRQRTIKSIQVKQTRSANQSSETIKPCERETPS